MPRELTVVVAPTSEQWPAFGAWAVARRIRSLPGRAFDVPQRLLSELPVELVTGATINGEVYYPDQARIAHDAPPLEDDEPEPVPVAPPWRPDESPPDPDDVPTTGAPGEESP